MCVFESVCCVCVYVSNQGIQLRSRTQRQHPLLPDGASVHARTSGGHAREQERRFGGLFSLSSIRPNLPGLAHDDHQGEFLGGASVALRPELCDLFAHVVPGSFVEFSHRDEDDAGDVVDVESRIRLNRGRWCTHPMGCNLLGVSVFVKERGLGCYGVFFLVWCVFFGYRVECSTTSGVGILSTALDARSIAFRNTLLHFFESLWQERQPFIPELYAVSTRCW